MRSASIRIRSNQKVAVSGHLMAGVEWIDQTTPAINMSYREATAQNLLILCTCKCGNKKRLGPHYVTVLIRRNKRFNCSSCLSKTVNKSKKPSNILPCIDIEQTIAQFGYDPRYLKPMSDRKVVFTCSVCNSYGTRKLNGLNRAQYRSCDRCLIDLRSAAVINRRREYLDKQIVEQVKMWKDHIESPLSSFDAQLIAWIFWCGSVTYSKGKRFNAINLFMLVSACRHTEGINQKIRQQMMERLCSKNTDRMTFKRRVNKKTSRGVKYVSDEIAVRLTKKEALRVLSLLNIKTQKIIKHQLRIIILEFVLNRFDKNLTWHFFNVLFCLGSPQKISNSGRYDNGLTSKRVSGRSFNFSLYGTSQGTMEVSNLIKKISDKFYLDIEVHSTKQYNQPWVYFTLKSGTVRFNDMFFEKSTDQRRDSWVSTKL